MHLNGLKLSRVSSKGTVGVFAAVTFTKLLALVFVAFIVIGSPSFAQSQAAPMPANAQPKSYGEGWECDRGYRRDGDTCLAIIVPQNAYATKRTYGAAWECLHGFQEVDDATCLEVIVPDGGYLDPSGKSWSCLRGYMKVDDLCLNIDLPPHAYLSDRGYGAWLCDRGYEVESDTCVAIAVPENAFLNGCGYGSHGPVSEAILNAMTPMRLSSSRRTHISMMRAMAQAGSVIAALQSPTTAAQRSTSLTMRISTDRETTGSATGIFSGRRGDAS